MLREKSGKRSTHWAQVRTALAKIQRPTGWMSPLSSRRGMNSLGPTGP